MLTDKQKQELIQSQLTLRAMIWDAAGRKNVEQIQKRKQTQNLGNTDFRKTEKHTGCMKKKMETAKLERECDRFAVCILPIPAGQWDDDKTERQKSFQTPRDNRAVYQYIKHQLHEHGIFMHEAVLVTDDSRLASEVYHMRLEDTQLAVNDRKSGLAVVYYEDIEEQEEVSADFIVQGFEETGIQFFDRVQKRKNGLPWNILYTKRTCVREITMEDLDELYAIYQEPGMTDYIEPLYEREMEEKYTKSYIQSMYYYYGYGMWVVTDIHTGELIGRAGIEHRDRNDEVWMELGYVIRKEYQNQGYATEVCTSVLEYAAQELEMEEMHCFIYKDNQASIRVAKKLGFAFAGNMEDGQRDTLHFYKKLMTNDS